VPTAVVLLVVDELEIGWYSSSGNALTATGMVTCCGRKNGILFSQ
jgi:hypothetical protein